MTKELKPRLKKRQIAARIAMYIGMIPVLLVFYVLAGAPGMHGEWLDQKPNPAANSSGD